MRKITRMFTWIVLLLSYHGFYVCAITSNSDSVNGEPPTEEYYLLSKAPGHSSTQSSFSYSEPMPSPVKSALHSKADNVFVPYRFSVLDRLLDQYDKRAWPTYGKSGESTKVDVNIYVNSLGSVNAANMEYKTDIYLRQSWLDRRLNMTRFGVNQSLTLNGEDIASHIWKPDLFFRNVKQASFHYVTVPNVLVRIAPNGMVLLSMRLTLTLYCHMSFRNYPLDTQICHIIVGTYAQTTDQTTLFWQDTDPITVDEQVEVPEFDIVSITNGQFTRDIDTGAFSFLNVSFVLQRQNGYHVVQTYMPTFLIVMISWVSFWLHVDASPARVTLGVTTLLTLTTVASGVRTQLPPVSYVKAIDVWIGACSVMVFGALLEFALVNFLSRSKFRTDELRKSIGLTICQDTSSSDRDRDPKKATGPNKCLSCSTIQSSINPSTPAAPPIPIHLKRAKLVDRVSRVMFPLAFFVFNGIYWSYYLNAKQ